ncbi:hypothetical protein ACWDTG_25950 [Rhodococcus zopfii]
MALAGVVIGAAATVIGISTRYAPPEIDNNTPAKVNSVENGIEDLSDAQERSQDRMREEGIDHGHAENEERLKVTIPDPPRFPR